MANLESVRVVEKKNQHASSKDLTPLLSAILITVATYRALPTHPSIAENNYDTPKSVQPKEITNRPFRNENPYLEKGRKAFAKAEELKLRGSYYNARDEYEEALGCFQECEGCEKQALITALSLAECKWLIAQRSSRFPSSEILDDLHFALDLATNNELPEWEVLVLRRIGQFHLSYSKFEEAKDWVRKAIDAAVELGNRKLEAECLITLGDIFRHRGSSAAESFYRKANHVAEEIGDLDLQAKAERHLVLYYNR